MVSSFLMSKRNESEFCSHNATNKFLGKNSLRFVLFLIEKKTNYRKLLQAHQGEKSASQEQNKQKPSSASVFIKCSWAPA